MITILPADEMFLRSIHAPADVDAMVLRDGDGTVFGYALFRVTGDTVEILQVETEVPLMTEALIRSVLNTGDCRGAVTGVCRIGALASVLKRLKFVPAEDCYEVSIEAFFRSGCRHEKEKA